MSRDEPTQEELVESLSNEVFQHGLRLGKLERHAVGAWSLPDLVAQLRALGVLHYKTQELELVLGPPPAADTIREQDPEPDVEDPDEDLWAASGLRPDLSRMRR